MNSDTEAKITPDYVSFYDGTTRTTLNASSLISTGTMTISNATLNNVTGITENSSDSSTKIATTAFVKAQNYSTISALSAEATERSSADTTLSANISSLNTSLASYAKVSSLSVYATIASLASYATTASLSAYATVASLSSYATTASLSAYATWGAYQSFWSGIETNTINTTTTTSNLTIAGNTSGYTYIPTRCFINGTFTGSSSPFNVKSSNDAGCGDGISMYPVSIYNYIITFYSTGGSVRGRIDGVNGTTVAYTTSSDRRLKTNIQPMDPMMDKIMSLKPSKYNWKEDNEPGYGFIAQEVHQVFPELRFRHSTCCENLDEPTNCETGEPIYYGVDYGKFTPYIVKAMQEMKTDYDNKLASLESRLLILENR